MNTNRVSRIIGVTAQGMITKYRAQRLHPSRPVAAIRSQPTDNLSELQVCAIDFVGPRIELRGTTENVQSLIEPMRPDLSPHVVCSPRLRRINKNHREGLVRFSVSSDECAGGRGGFETKEIQTKETSGASSSQRIWGIVRPTIQNTDQESELIDPEPGTAGQEIFSGQNFGFRRP